MRAGTQGNTGQHALAGTHIHFVRAHPFCNVTREDGGCAVWQLGAYGQIGVNINEMNPTARASGLGRSRKLVLLMKPGS